MWLAMTMDVVVHVVDVACMHLAVPYRLRDTPFLLVIMSLALLFRALHGLTHAAMKHG